MKHGAALLIGPSVLLLALIGGGGFAIDHARGIPSHHRQAGVLPMDNRQSQFNRMVDQMQLPTDTCGSSPPPGITWCFANNLAKASFALYGDSHAYQYVPSLLNPATAADGWLLLGRPGCPPVLHIDFMIMGKGNDCGAQNDWAQAVLKQRRDVTTVVMSSLTTPYFRNTTRMDVPPTGALRQQTTYYTGDPQDVYYQGLRDSIASLQAAGKRIVLMIDNPELQFTADRCLGRRRLQMFLARALPQCVISRADYLANNAAFREMAARLKAEHPGLLVYDPVDTFCGPQDCPVVRQGRSLFNDASHLSEYGARLAGRRLLAWMADQGIPMSEQAKAYAALLSQY
jgi:hypothetical protein